MTVHDFPANRQAQPRAAATGLGLARLHELGENEFQFVRRYAGAFIADADQKGLADAAGLHVDRPARRRELDRVAQQVADDLFESLIIGEHGRRFLRLAIADANVLAGDHRAELVDDDLDERVHARRLQVEHHAARLEFGKIEQIVHEVQQVFGTLAHIVEKLAAARRGRPLRTRSMPNLA